MIRNASLIILIFLISSCGGSNKKPFMPDSTRWTDQDIPLDELPTGNVNTDSIERADKMRQMFPPGDSLIEGRPVSFYLQRSDISQTAKEFYLQRYTPISTDSKTVALCDSLLTKNDTTRSFYFFLFMRLSRLDPDEFGDLLPRYADQYSLTFVDEFYRRIALPQYRWSYSTWVADVGSFESVGKSSSPDEVRQHVIQLQMTNAKRLTLNLKKEIQNFADSVAQWVSK
ncbi:MAG: hypothetical protein Q8916_02620 [Bacteroidota bacterium]|nr:hypothetical protein [Bacteroidota bacterium]MDP4229281.1 hypothetical protein [Bacteroidota bacterium]MDP4234894.1 hypothetical protein [Bacteroidota bacterium]